MLNSESFLNQQSVSFINQSAATFNDVPVKARRRSRIVHSTDSDDVEFIEDPNVESRISDEILKTATHELSEPKMQLTSFFDEEGVQNSMCRDLVQHP